MDQTLKNRTAGFWIRLVTRAIDFIWPFAIGIAIAFSFLKTTNGQKDFAHPYLFYVWCLITIVLFFVSFVLLPFLTKGRTVGMLITRTKIVFEKSNKFTSICRREIVMGFTWILVMILLMLLVNHTLIGKFAQNKQNTNNYSNLEKLRIGIVSSVSTIMIIVQFLCAIGIIIRKDKTGFHDRMSSTTTVWEKRFTEVKIVNNEVKGINPRPIKNEIIEWVE